MNRNETPAPMSATGVWPGFNPEHPLELNPHHLPSGTSYALPARESCARTFGLTWKVKICDHHIEVAKELPCGDEEFCILQHKNISTIILEAKIRPDNSGVDVGIFARNEELNLEVPLYLSEYSEDVAYFWQSWGKKLGAPLSMRMPDGLLKNSHSRLGSIMISNPLARRAWGKAKRRPSIMASRGTSTPRRLNLVR